MARAAAFKKIANAPLTWRYISPNKNYIRPQNYDQISYIFRCLWTQEQPAGTAAHPLVDQVITQFCAANDPCMDAATAACAQSNPASSLINNDSFIWVADMIMSIIELFGTQGRIAPKRLSPASEKKLLDLLFVFTSANSHLEIATNANPLAPFEVYRSENLDIQIAYTFWHSSKLFTSYPAYARTAYSDNHYAQDHARAWAYFLKKWIIAHINYGLMVEFASTTYGAISLKGLYNIGTYSDDPSLRQLSNDFLDVYWMDWAQENMNGVRGGAKARVYSGQDSILAFSPNDIQKNALEQMVYYYAGLGPEPILSDNAMTMLTSSYWPDPLVLDVMTNTKARRSYECKNTHIGFNAVGNYGKIPTRITNQKALMRYTYCTPEFILGSAHHAALPQSRWAMISSQNRWAGAIFATHPNARLFVQCDVDLTNDPHRTQNYNAFWSVQSKGAMIIQKLDGTGPDGKRLSKYASQTKIWIASSGLADISEDGGWIFLNYNTAFAAINITSGGYQKTADRTLSQYGSWLVLNQDLAPIIIDIGSFNNFTSINEFKNKIKATPLQFSNNIINYKSLSNDNLALDTSYKLMPMINGRPIDLANGPAFASPFMTSMWNSGKVTLKDTRGTQKTLNFTS
jgi:hypothetical protein